jgi:replicative DNA helicase
MSETKVHYDFDNGFQEKILGVMLRDPTFLEQQSDVINPSYFQSPYHQRIARFALDYFYKYRSKPTRNALIQIINDSGKKLSLDKEDLEVLSATLEVIYSQPLEDSTFVKAKAREFGQYQAIKLAIIELTKYVTKSKESPDKYPLESSLRILQKGVNVGRGSDSGVKLFDFLESPKKAREQDALSDPSRRVRTAFPTIDAALKGGLGAGELGIVMGESGLGKSMFLINIAAAAALTGKKVCYMTLELKPFDIICRTLARITDMTIDDVETESEDYKTKANKLKKVLSENFRIKYFKPSEATVGSIRAFLARTEMIDESRPDIIIVDYLDEMKGLDSHSDSASSYYAWGDVCAELIDLAADYKCPLWTATQVRRDAYGKTPGMESAGESMKKVNKADLILALAQDDEELENSRIRVKILKMRRGNGKGKSIKCISKLDKATIKEIKLSDQDPPLND